jgi:O-methyltransferase involved in polyketide biosynthesis
MPINGDVVGALFASAKTAFSPFYNPVERSCTMSTALTGIPETLLIPVWARAVENHHPDPIIRDERASELMSQIKYDFSKFESARLSQLGISIRTRLLDDAVMAFLGRNERAVVVNLGAGLDTRYERIGLYGQEWYDLDLPEAIELRRRFFIERQACRFLEKSVFDISWMDDIEDNGRAVLLIAEGLLMYFSEPEVKRLFKDLVNRFPQAEILLEVIGSFLMGRSKRHDAVSKIDGAPEFKWGIKNSREMARWHPSIEFVNEWCYFDYYKERAGWFGRFARLPFVRPRLASRIVHLRFNADPELKLTNEK